MRKGFVNLLLGDEVDALVDLAEATSADLSRHFPSLLDITITMSSHFDEDASFDDIDNDDDDSDDHHNSYDDWNDQDLDDVPGLQEILTRLMAGHIQAEAGESFFVEIFDGCYSALGHY